jgi:ribulose bisphosphate carboxylase small subunit
MDKRLSSLSMIMTSLPVVLAFGAILLFSVGYLANKTWGANNPVEEMVEDLLDSGYKITVEFSGEKK